jgi:hypothetical protein
MTRRPLLLTAIVILSLSLGACNGLSHECQACSELADGFTLTLCTANVPVTETSDGALNCTPLNLPLPSN